MSGTRKTTAIEPSLSEKELESAARERINNQAELYCSLVRALKRRRGFGILFVQCTPAKGKEIFSRLKTDLTKKRIGRLTLTEPIDNLKALIEAREDLNELNVLFIEGIEHSLSPYIKSEIGRNDYYKLEVLPPILDHLNLHRENFRNQFKHLCLVFVVPPFALKYFMYRAVDFFSWHSGIWTFAIPEEELARETASALAGEFSQYSELSEEERDSELIRLQNLIDVRNQPDEQREVLLVKQSMMFAAVQDWNLALKCIDDVLSMTRKADSEAQFIRGILLSQLARSEDAINAYNLSIEGNPNHYESHYSKGVILSELGRYEEAISAYDAALSIKPDDHRAFHNKGAALSGIGRYEEAISAYDTALSIKPDLYESLFNKGIALSKLGQYEEAIAAYDSALVVVPHNAITHYNKARIYAFLLQHDDAIACLQKAIALDGTNKYIEMAKTDTDFDAIRDRPQFQALIAQHEKQQISDKRSPDS